MKIEKKLSLLCIVLITCIVSSCQNPLSYSEQNAIGADENTRALSGNDYIELYPDSNFRGTPYIVYKRRGIINLPEHIANKVSSFKYISVNRQGPDSDEVLLFSESGANGVAIAASNSENLSWLGFNDLVTSVQFSDYIDEDSMYIDFYTEPDFRGQRYRRIVSRSAKFQNIPSFKSVYYWGRYPIQLYGNNDKGYAVSVYLGGNQNKVRNIASMGITGTGVLYGPTDDTPSVILYSGDNYTGDQRVICFGQEFLAADLTKFNFSNRAQSIRTYNCVVQCFDYANYTGYSKLWVGNKNLFGYSHYRDISALRAKRLKYGSHIVNIDW